MRNSSAWDSKRSKQELGLFIDLCRGKEPEPIHTKRKPQACWGALRGALLDTKVKRYFLTICNFHAMTLNTRMVVV